MKVEETTLKDCFVVVPDILTDTRGYFYESYNMNKFSELTGMQVDFVQDNESFSSYGTIRGLHMQYGGFSQAKLVRVVKGEVLDVAVDARPGSLTYGRYFSVILNEQNKKQLFIPRGFLHGFSVLSETAIFSYKCDNFYSRSSEAGVRFDDPDLDINWQLPEEKILISDKDKSLPLWKEFIKLNVVKE